MIARYLSLFALAALLLLVGCCARASAGEVPESIAAELARLNQRLDSIEARLGSGSPCPAPAQLSGDTVMVCRCAVDVESRRLEAARNGWRFFVADPSDVRYPCGVSIWTAPLARVAPPPARRLEWVAGPPVVERFAVPSYFDVPVRPALFVVRPGLFGRCRGVSATFSAGGCYP